MNHDKDIFYQTTLRICGSLNLSQALYDCLEYLADIIPLNEINVHIFNETSGYIRTIASADNNGPSPDSSNNIVKMPKIAVDQLRGKALADLRIVNNPVEDRVTYEMAKIRGKEESSFVIMRLVINYQRLGTITFRADKYNQYKEEHGRLLESLRKPFGIALSNSLQYEQVNQLRERLEIDNEQLQKELLQESKEKIIGEKFGLKSVMEHAKKVAATNSPVLILGETGTGKEVIANAIHYMSKRDTGPFIKVNCGAIPENLIDSELFGHEKGAFTGATARKKGRFERAENGTIFLDEIGELPLSAQTRLLRVLSEKEIERVGGHEVVKLNIRVIAATHKDLKAMVNKGEFRDDLWYRLSVFPLQIPPLRERREDLPALVNYFILERGKEMGMKNIPEVSADGFDRLNSYSFPGNVRELKNIVEREMIINQSNTLSFDNLVPESVSGEKNKNEVDDVPVMKLKQVIVNHLRKILQKTNGKIEGANGAANLLGLNPSTLRNKLRKYDIPFGRNKKP